MKIIAFIEQAELIKKILKHLGLWLVKKRPPPRIHSPPAEFYVDYGSTDLTEVSDSQIPPLDDDYSLAALPGRLPGQGARARRPSHIL